jgi:hypothetical protein
LDNYAPKDLAREKEDLYETHIISVPVLADGVQRVFMFEYFGG